MEAASVGGEEMRAASALLGVSPAISSNQHTNQADTKAAEARPNSYAGLESLAEQANALHQQSRLRVVSNTSPPPPSVPLSGALDALATLASEARSRETNVGESMDEQLNAHVKATGITSPSTSSSSGSDNDDDESNSSMPPPPPRHRPRSCSNPEGMEKWDSLNQDRSTRRHFVIPASILEEELAEASAAIRQRKLQETAIPEEPENYDDEGTPSPDSVVDHPVTHAPNEEDDQFDGKEEEEEEPEREIVDESSLSPEDLLKRARSRLLEDLSEGNMNGDKGVLTLPHSLGKYKEVYNKNGRIGIYTPAERAAIIARFNKKRQRRVWNKKIRYNCRKSLADRRLRVKGRFVKRSEQEQLAKELQARVEKEVVEDCEEASTPQTSSEERTPGEQDEEMPDVSDPDAGFAPTEDHPYRRLRRHTIT
eukprot:CAMPEP_0168748414 /NCGR_PEP_ID=MMETSP0724-20121128/16162_1 /TAXON_ID=265536 /ORGANISM="Amphiprora sp., Strain CCMP467" /LENGTH=424 /DNA_ID=CAMNT_0008796239 /DNA_START=126 /DNA_END=1400 /DNA_ORIENTATION=-